MIIYFSESGLSIILQRYDKISNIKEFVICTAKNKKDNLAGYPFFCLNYFDVSFVNTNPVRNIAAVPRTIVR